MSLAHVAQDFTDATFSDIINIRVMLAATDSHISYILVYFKPRVSNSRPAALMHHALAMPAANLAKGKKVAMHHVMTT